VAGAALAVTCPGPDTFGHECTVDPPGDCTFLPTSTVIGTSDDNCSAVPVGFTFNFYGAPVTTVGVASNGFLMMNGCGAGAYDYTNDCPVPSAFTPNNIAMGVWDDLLPSTGMITYGVSGLAPDRVFAATYNNVPYYGGGGVTTFQIQLHENGGTGEKVIVTILQAQQTGYSTGIENATGSDGLSRFCNNGPSSNCTEYSAAPPSTGGSCDLTEIEAKLDDESRFTDDDELLEVRDEWNGQLAALEAKMDDLTGSLCDIVRLLHTPSGIRTADCGGQHYDWNDDGTLHD
jgi:hypothetical protein